MDFHIGFTRQMCHLRHVGSPIFYELTRDDALLVRVRDTRKMMAPNDKWTKAKSAAAAKAKANRAQRAQRADARRAKVAPTGDPEQETPAPATPRPEPIEGGAGVPETGGAQ